MVSGSGQCRQGPWRDRSRLDIGDPQFHARADIKRVVSTAGDVGGLVVGTGHTSPARSSPRAERQSISQWPRRPGPYVDRCREWNCLSSCTLPEAFAENQKSFSTAPDPYAARVSIRSREIWVKPSVMPARLLCRFLSVASSAEMQMARWGGYRWPQVASPLPETCCCMSSSDRMLHQSAAAKTRRRLHQLETEQARGEGGVPGCLLLVLSIWAAG